MIERKKEIFLINLRLLQLSFFLGGGLIPFVRRHVNAADIFFSASIAVEFLQRKLLDIVEKIFHWLML